MKQFVMIAVVAIVLTGCNNAQTTPSDNPTQTSNKNMTEKKDTLSVVASFYPLAYMAERIGGEYVDVANVVGAADPHDYALSPRDITAFQDADVVLLQGANLEPWGEDIQKQLAVSGKLTVVAEGITLMESGKDHGEDGDEHEQEHDGHDEHDDEHEDEGEHKGEEVSDDGHDHGAFDPHTWLDPVLAQDMAQLIADAFTTFDPGNAAAYAANLATLKSDFADLDQAYAQALGACTRSDVIVSHDAFGYLAERYNFTVHPIAGISSRDEPSAKTLALLKAEAAEGITHILAEATSVNRFAQTLAGETSLTMLPISALASPSSSGEDFFDRAGENLTQIRTALGCSVQ